MKKILSERNIAAILFLLVFIVFSFAHEYSKKRYINYNTSVPSVSADNSVSSFVSNQEELTSNTDQIISLDQ